jgi:hypothetical protein
VTEKIILSKPANRLNNNLSKRLPTSMNNITMNKKVNIIEPGDGNGMPSVASTLAHIVIKPPIVKGKRNPFVAQ